MAAQKPEKPKRKNHKFDPITDVCDVCGCMRLKVPYVSDGFNRTLANRFINKYSMDGKTYSSEFINCEKPK